MLRNPTALAFTALLMVAQVACASFGDDANDQVGEMSIVFPQNDTYAVVSPFPVIFGYQNAPALLSYNSELSWSVQCAQGSLYGSDTINGYKYAEVPSGAYYILNSTKTLQDALPSGSKDPKGSYGSWRGAEDACALSWAFHYWTVCSKQPDDATLIQSGVGKRTGKMYFTVRPGAKLPRDAIREYQGCALKGTAEKVANTSIACPNLLTQPEAQPCNLDVKAAASSLAGAAVSPTTSFTGTSTSSIVGATTTLSSSGSSGTGGSTSPKKDSSASTVGRDSHSILWTISTCLFMLHL
ncbi:hypothetical protein A9K55_001181 [Cordyceps militaris]|uniref:DUF7136 domain-containing protein n=1 Tax=Cordyceps militaris TaxID=73501 RepID=A0A2H4SSZ3_CORMI|nr:hypothetical protein A9K55_001181 [Cordyceps militaris]